MSRKPVEWEVRISVYRNGRRVMTSDALGDDPDSALYAAHNDLELWAQDHPESRANRDVDLVTSGGAS